MSEGAAALPRGRMVVVVDDHGDVADLIRIVLERAGYQVRCAPTAEAALGMVGDSRPDLVISDIHMPGMGGVLLAGVLQARRDPVPVLLTSVDRPRIADDLPFLPKPFSLDALVAAVGAAVSGSGSARA